jgi:hypothetical protein
MVDQMEIWPYNTYIDSNKQEFDMQVGFTRHAAERFSQRLNISIKQDQRVNIASAFTLAKTYTNEKSGRKCEAWCHNDTTQKVVLIIDSLTRDVVTVYMGALEDVYGTNIVSACYSLVAKKQQPYRH